MAEILTPKEGSGQGGHGIPVEGGPAIEGAAEQSPEQRHEGAVEGAGEQAGSGGVSPPPVYDPQDHDDATHATLKANPQDQQVEKLKHMALQEGALKAIFHAKKLDDPYVIDELHDALVDELRTQLFEQGRIEEL